MKPLTLKTILSLSYAGVLTLLLALLGFAAYHLFARQLDADATAELKEITEGLRGYLRFQDGTPVLAYDRTDPAQAAFIGEATRYYQIYDASTGRPLVPSSALEPLGLQYTPDEARAFRTRPRVYDIRTEQGRIRFSNTLIPSASGSTYLLQIGVLLDDEDRALGRFWRLLLGGIPVAMLIVVVVGRWMATRGLAPLARLAAAMRAIGVERLNQRLPVRGAADELDEVAEAFNAVLARLEHAVGEMRQFSAAMAHELRTPLAAIRGEIELALMHPRSPEEYQRGLASQLEDLDTLTRLIERLLTLARAEAGEIALARDPVDIAALSASVVETVEAVARARDIELMCTASETVCVIGDARWLERLLLNLLDNAIKFTGAGGRIDVSVSRDEGTARLEVRDTGIGISSEALPHLFERFYRADPARTREVEGAGLGLSLVKWIADRHGAAIEVASAPGSGTTITFRQPLASPLAPAPSSPASQINGS